MDADATATAVSVAGSGFLSFCPAVAATAVLVDSAFPTDVDAVVDVAVKAATTTAVSVAGSGFLSFCLAAVAATTTAADADAANILVCEGPC